MNRAEQTAATAALLRCPTAALILRALHYWPAGLTAPELAAVASRQPSTIRATLTALRLAGLAARTTHTHATRRQSRPARVWTRTQ